MNPIPPVTFGHAQSFFIPAPITNTDNDNESDDPDLYGYALVGLLEGRVFHETHSENEEFRTWLHFLYQEYSRNTQGYSSKYERFSSNLEGIDVDLRSLSLTSSSGLCELIDAMFFRYDNNNNDQDKQNARYLNLTLRNLDFHTWTLKDFINFRSTLNEKQQFLENEIPPFRLHLIDAVIPSLFQSLISYEQDSTFVELPHFMRDSGVSSLPENFRDQQNQDRVILSQLDLETLCNSAPAAQILPAFLEHLNQIGSKILILEKIDFDTLKLDVATALFDVLLEFQSDPNRHIEIIEFEDQSHILKLFEKLKIKVSKQPSVSFFEEARVKHQKSYSDLDTWVQQSTKSLLDSQKLPHKRGLEEDPQTILPKYNKEDF